MASGTNSQLQSREPTDVPTIRSPNLEALNALVGTWFISMTHVDLPDTVHGQKTFGWLEGGYFLVEHSHFNHPDVPDSISMIGVADSSGGLSEHYFDSRGVLRVMKMSLSAGIWKVWRDAPGFSQRFTGKFNDDGNIIEVSGELSKDGVNWQHDFTHTYTKGKKGYLN
jgi:hypothetical protein